MDSPSPQTLTTDILERADRWLDGIPLRDTWHIDTEDHAVAHIRTSAYVDRELHWAEADGKTRTSGLSAQDIDARPGHRITVVRVTARNSGRRRSVILYNHHNGKLHILRGHFAPLLRSRYEGLVFLACLSLCAALISLGLWIHKVWPGRRRKDPGSICFILGAAMIPLGIVFTDKRRQRLRRDLEETCTAIAARLHGQGSLEECELAVTPAATETPRP